MAGTKEKILNAALDLFSENGYEAVSVGQLAAAVGVKAPSLYKHYESKQDIFDALVEYMVQKYESQSILALPEDRDKGSDFAEISGLSPDKVSDRICVQVRFITSDPIVSKTRKLCVIEQFRNSVLAEKMEKYQYQEVYDYNRGLIHSLIAGGFLRDCDEEIMALQLMSPITIQIQRIDRYPDCIEDALRLIRQHITQFFNIYGM